MALRFFVKSNVVILNFKTMHGEKWRRIVAVVVLNLEEIFLEMNIRGFAGHCGYSDICHL